MQKYLFHFGYIGTHFSGVANDAMRAPTKNSVAFYIEQALHQNLPSNVRPNLTFSSRTDTGVHAISSTFDCTLPPSYPINYIVNSINKSFTASDLNIRIYGVQPVPSEFSSRFSAFARTYLYRIAQSTSISIKHLPILELNRCQLVRGELNISPIQEACKLLQGTHDFQYYTNTKAARKTHTTRTLYEVKFVPGAPLFDPQLDDLYEGLNFWDVIISGRGFLYKQVRRTVAFLLAVGRGLKTVEDVKSTLSNPQQVWDNRIDVAKPEGLFLINVEYPPEAFLEQPTNARQTEDSKKVDLEEENRK